MPIPQPTRDECLALMDALMSRPCAAVFLDPVTSEDAPNYPQVIKRPADLGAIRRRLAGDEFPSVTVWAREISLIWKNAETYNGRESLLYALASELRRNVDRGLRRVRRLNTQKWGQTVGELKDALDALLDAPPAPVAGFATVSEKPDPNQQKPFSDEELDQFSRASTRLWEDHDAQAMLEIIRGHDPGFEGPNNAREIDVGALSVPAMHALRQFLRRRLGELGMPWPR